MNKFKSIIFLLVIMFVVLLSACSKSNSSSVVNISFNNDNQMVLEMSDGTFKLVDLDKVEEPISVVSASIDNNGHLILKLSNDEEVDAGFVLGKDGREIEVSISSTHIRWRYHGEDSWKNLVRLDSLGGGTDYSNSRVLLGIDLIDDNLEIFENKRVGLITNQTGMNSDYVSTVDVLMEKVNLVALFAPEHGIRGELQAGAGVGTYVDSKTGLTVYSLYGQTQKPTVAMLNEVDILCIDIQDVGARFYTYVYTMAYAMEAVSEAGKEFVVFDRPNPIGGEQFEGNILDMNYASFIGRFPIVQRHGLTIGELAMLFNSEYEINCDLTVIKMNGWERGMYFDDTNLPWVIPSPNMPTVETAIVYIATCIIEGTNLSEGRGTTKPFEFFGAPFVDADELSEALNALELPGVHFRAAYFEPSISKNANKLNAGVQVHVINRRTFSPVKTSFAIVEVLRDLYPSNVQIIGNFNQLAGNSYLRDRVYSLEELFTIIDEDTALFAEIREKYLLY